MATHLTTDAYSGMLISEEARQLRERALSKLWEILTAEALKIAHEKGERTVRLPHIKEAIKRKAEVFRKILVEVAAS